MKRENLAIAVSLANLCFLRFWYYLTLPNGSHIAYFAPSVYPVTCVAVLLCVSLLSVVFYGLLTVTFPYARLHGPVHGFLALFLIFAAFGLKASFLGYTIDFDWFFWLVPIFGAAICFVPFIRKFFRGVLVCATPYAAFTLSLTLWSAFTLPHQSVREETTTGKVLSENKKMLVLIFDELDMRAMFDDEKSYQWNAEFRRLRDTAVNMETAFSPARNTLESISSYLTGRTVKSTYRKSRQELLLHFEEGMERNQYFHEADILFYRLNEIGVRSSVVGWCHPYCRLFGPTLAHCTHLNNFSHHIGYDGGLLTNMAHVIREQVMPLTSQEGPRTKKIAYDRALATIKERLADNSSHFLFVHLPTPHSPWIYDLVKKGFVIRDKNPAGYFHDLALTDRTLGEIRRFLEEKNLWNDTHIIVTSDHPWRSWKAIYPQEDKRIPFLVKLAGQQKPMTYKEPFQTIALKDLVLSIYRKEIQTPEQAVNWLRAWHQSPPKTATYKSSPKKS